MRGRWKLLIAVAIVIVAAVASALVMSLRPGSPAPGSPQSGLGPSGKLGFPVSQLAVGQGGTKTAADGKTPIGYDGSCDSAAQAAANYLPLRADFNAKTWETQKKALVQVSLPGPQKDLVMQVNDGNAANKAYQDAGFDGGWLQRFDVKAGGLYRIVSCEANKSALVQVFTGSLWAQMTTAPRPAFATQEIELAWDGDWKYSNAFQPSDDPTIGRRLKDTGPSLQPEDFTQTLQVLTAKDVDVLFQGKSREGWVEYANATR
ncbi:hypothetical protein [Arthrobacter sp. efr-133-R2A-120]|uniref:hypothetical protein n=1 Tax=Arthrobacter sp. efr-133-R2A-120 TaxID=3040277 RepID=UPI00254EC9D2|nr:hypothetical protein [Arthrobacter sp. efr-133-R2A-120]